ncbi:MAG: creatininase family protein [Deltaproteobacteria bacterium]|nr:creatininase family protein [Deltaproteobacteria bacterium]
MILEELSMKEFEKKATKIKTVIIPVGSLEAHGPHLPLGTDTIEVYEIAKRVAQLVDVFVAPPLSYGLCRSTSKHPGTVVITGDTLRNLIKDIVKSLHSNNLKRFLIISGHASSLHLAALQEAGESLLEELPSDVNIAVVSAYALAQEAASEICETEDDSHAGEIETSLILHLKPHLVKGRGKEEYPHFPHPLLTRNKRKYWKNAVWGNPHKASTKKGELISQLLINKISELVREIEKFKE